MSESFRTSQPEPPWSSPSHPGNGHRSSYDERSEPESGDGGEAGKVLLVGVLGGLLSAAGYMIYRRLPDEQKERLHSQVRSAVKGRISELRQNFNF